MMKTMIYILFLNILISCSSCEKTIEGWGNPDIGRYIGWSSQILSTRTGEIITPIYEVTLSKKTNDIITRFEFNVSYNYGQEFQFHNKSYFIWNKNSRELIELNSNGFVTIRKELWPIKREELLELENTFTFTAPDGEDMQGHFTKISFMKEKRQTQ